MQRRIGHDDGLDTDGVHNHCDDDVDGDGWTNDVETLCGSDQNDVDYAPPFGCIGMEDPLGS